MPQSLCQPQLKPCAVPKKNEVKCLVRSENLSQIVSIQLQIDMQRTCRLCLCSSDNLKSIFDWSKDSDQLMTISEQLLSYANIQVRISFRCLIPHTKNMITCFVTVGNAQIQPDDGLPNGVCQTCARTVGETYAHKMLCEQSDATLRQYYMKQAQNIADTSPTAADCVVIETESCWSDSFWAQSQMASATTADTASSPCAAESETGQCEITATATTNTVTALPLDGQLSHQPVQLQQQRSGFQCGYCPKTFAQTEERSCHMKVHSVGSVRYCCVQCPKTFSRKDYLT